MFGTSTQVGHLEFSGDLTTSNCPAMENVTLCPTAHIFGNVSVCPKESRKICLFKSILLCSFLCSCFLIFIYYFKQFSYK